MGVGLGAVDEGQESREVEVALIIGGQVRALARRPGGDGDHAAAGGELLVEHRLGRRCDVAAAREDDLRRPLDDDLAPAVDGPPAPAPFHPTRAGDLAELAT